MQGNILFWLSKKSSIFPYLGPEFILNKFFQLLVTLLLHKEDMTPQYADQLLFLQSLQEGRW